MGIFSLEVIFVLLAASAAFTVSVAAGLGGSLILEPSLHLLAHDPLLSRLPRPVALLCRSCSFAVVHRLVVGLTLSPAVGLAVGAPTYLLPLRLAADWSRPLR